MTADPIRDEEGIFHAARALPSPDERAAYLDRACGADAALRARVEALLTVYLTEPSDGGVVPGAGAGPALFEQLASAAQLPEEPPGTVIGRYKLLERIGEGGFGVVYLAEQHHPVRRKVALKLIKAGLDTRQVIARFEAERQALAMMAHENIAKVLDAGATEAGRPYFVMELVRGVPITDYCDAHRLSPRQRLELFIPVCRAIQHAHTKGIIHRDIKPTNVLVTIHDGVAVPKVIDFGVAKATGQGRLTEGTLFTQFAQMVGTPLYMSPEQAEMAGADVDTRSDVYSLGVVLYELLTGTTPFDRDRLKQAAHDEVRRIVREEEPPRPSTRLSGLSGEQRAAVSARRGTEPGRLGQVVRGELDWIVMKALEKDRARRYETPNGLARDVEQYLGDEPVSACPPSAAYRFGKFARRNKAALLTALVIAAVLVLAAAVSTHQAARARAAERAARRAAAELALDKGQLLGEAGDASLALLWLARALTLAPPDAVDLHAAIRRGLGAWREHVNTMRAILPQQDAGVYAVAVAPDRSLLTASVAVGTGGVRVVRWDAAGDRAAHQVTFAGEPFRRCLAFSPDAATLLIGMLDGRVQLGDVAGGAVLWERRISGGHAACAAFSPDGQTLLIGYDIRSSDARGPTGRAQLVHAATGEPLGPVLEHRRPVRAAAFRPDGRSFVTGCGIWGNATEAVETRFWDLQGRETRSPLAHTCVAISAAFSPDGRTLLTGHWDRRAWLWDLSGAREPVALQHEGPVATVAFSRDGRTLLTGAFDGTVRIWDAQGRLLGPPLRQGHLVDMAVFGPDDKSILVATRGGSARTWDLAAAGTGVSAPHDAATFPLAVSADGRTVLTRDAEGTVVIRDAATSVPVGAPLPHPGPTHFGGTSVLPGRRYACSSDRRRALVVEPDDAVKLWDAQSGRLVAELKTAGDEALFYAAAFSPDSKLIAIGHGHYAADVWDAETGTFLRRLPHGPSGGVFAVDFSPDGRFLLTGSGDNAASFWDPLTGKLLGPTLLHNTVVLAVAYSPDGRTVVTGDVDHNVQLWDVATRKRRLHLTGHRGSVNAAEFSPDGSQAVTGSGDHTARLWDVATGKPIGPPLPHRGAVVQAGFSSDGNGVQTATQDQDTFAWRVPPPIGGTAEDVVLWAQVATGMELGPDGGVQILDAPTWQARRQFLKAPD